MLTLDDMPCEMTRQEFDIRTAALDGVEAMRRAGADREDVIHCLVGLSLHLVGELSVRERAYHIAVIREMLDWCAIELCAEAEQENKRSS
jgi:hypothetical protein